MSRGWMLTGATLLVVGVAALLTIFLSGDRGGSGPSAGAGGFPQPTAAQLAAARLDRIPLAPDRERVDLAPPRFSHPTRVTNPLFPIGALRSAILSGHVEGK